MVVRFLKYRKCDRCGASAKEAKLTRSHSPHSALASFCLPRHWRKQQRIYTLCEFCRLKHFELEKRVLQETCIRLIQLHEDYLNQ